MRLWLARESHNLIIRESRKRRIVETGGPLFGYRVEDDVVVTRAFGPGPKARHRPRSLQPDRQATQAAIELMHRESGGRAPYLGDWHTHPLGAARPSGRDIASLEAIAGQKAVDLDRPISIIQATRPLFAHLRIGELRAFEWDAAEARPRELEVQIYERRSNLPKAPIGRRASIDGMS